MRAHLIFIILAAIFAALSNLFFRRFSHSKDQDPSSYLLIYFVSSFFLVFALFPKVLHSPLQIGMILAGSCVGIFNFLMMQLTAKALKNGPSALTFAFQNVSSIFPSVLLFMIFGSQCGFSCTSPQLIGLILVVLGLLVGSRSQENSKLKTTWFFYAISCLVMQVAALSFIQGRYLIFGIEQHLAQSHVDDAWFMLGQFAICVVLQGIVCLRKGRHLFRREIQFGIFGGLCNFAATACLLYATTFALPQEKAMLFPIFAVSTIIFCNLWATRLYQEKFNFATNAICSLGIFLGSIQA